VVAKTSILTSGRRNTSSSLKCHRTVIDRVVPASTACVRLVVMSSSEEDLVVYVSFSFQW